MYFVTVFLIFMGALHTKDVQAQDKSGVLKKDSYGAFSFNFYEEILASDNVNEKSRNDFESKANISLDQYRLVMTAFVRDILKESSLKSAFSNSVLAKNTDLAPGTMVYTYGVTGGKIDVDHPSERVPYAKLQESFMYHEPTGIYWLSNACGNPCDFKDLTYEKKKPEAIVFKPNPSTTQVTSTHPITVNVPEPKVTILPVQNQQATNATGFYTAEQLLAMARAANQPSAPSSPAVQYVQVGDAKTDDSFSNDLKSMRQLRREIRKEKYLAKAESEIDAIRYGDEDGGGKKKGEFWQKPGGQFLLMTGASLTAGVIEGVANRATYGRGVLGVGRAEYDMNVGSMYANYPSYNPGGGIMYANQPVFNRPIFNPGSISSSQPLYTSSGIYVNNAGNVNGGPIWNSAGNYNQQPIAPGPIWGGGGQVVNNGGIWNGGNGGAWQDAGGNWHYN